MAVPRDQNGSAPPPEPLGERLVRRDDPRASLDRGLQDRAVALSLDREYRVKAREGGGGRSAPHPPGDEAVELLYHRRWDDDPGPRTNPLDLRLEGKAGAGREQ